MIIIIKVKLSALFLGVHEEWAAFFKLSFLSHAVVVRFFQILAFLMRNMEFLKTKADDGWSVSVNVADVGGGESVGMGVQKAWGV